ncbi:MAG: TnpV protein [Clostridia bacterium]|nr:TnpV protein [Clostridia bacterium]
MELKERYVDERSKIEYVLKDDYYVPNLTIPKDTNYNIGKYGKAHLKYIKEHKRVFYTDLLFDGRLNIYLH